MLQLILASQSPRRRELLTDAGYEFTVSPVKVSENIDENLTPEDLVTQLAIRKAQASANLPKFLNQKGYLVLGADTVVVFEGEVLGKPRDFSEATQFLSRLSARVHRVYSGLALLSTSPSKVWSGYDVTEVEFRSLSSDEIAEYVATGEPMDKAGAYGIQGLGGKFVSRFVGSWSNVVGLPLELLESALSENEWSVHRRTSEDR